MSESGLNHKWLAFELHDRLLPWIHGARMQLDGLAVDPASQSRLNVALQCLTVAAEEGRALIGFLEGDAPVISEYLAEQLLAAVQQLRPLAMSQGQRLVAEVPIVLPAAVSDFQAWNILRIAHQSMVNAIQHAGACSIVLATSLDEQAWAMTVSDSGVGFEESTLQGGPGFGLPSLRQRASAIGGTLELKNLPGEGTIVRLTMPCTDSRSPARGE